MLALIGVSVLVVLAKCDTGTTTRYWDCCKPSCGWPSKTDVGTVGNNAVNSCAKDGTTIVDPNTKNVCGGGGIDGPSYMCANQQPFAVNSSLAFGFAAATVANLNEPQWCCACYELTFTDTAIADKKMVVQVTNTGSDLGSNHFDIEIPGGGVGIFNGCADQYGAPSDVWGDRYGGVSSQSDCQQLPSALQSGCEFRFEWYQNADNPDMSLTRVACPRSLTSLTNCIRNDDSTQVQSYVNL